MKRCSRCGLNLDRSLFTKNSSRKDGLNSSCKECHSKYTKEHYRANKRYYKAKSHKNSERIRSYTTQLKESSPCVDCGEFYPACVMDFDHLGGKLFSISSAVVRKSFESIKAEILKCEIVCSNCHRIRTAKRRQHVSMVKRISLDSTKVEF